MIRECEEHGYHRNERCPLCGEEGKFLMSDFEVEKIGRSLAGILRHGKGNPEITEKIRREQALYQIACKAAIKGGRIYDKSVAEWIIKKVLELPDVIVCPHGRPIAYRLTKTELDRQFDRIK